MPTNWEKLTKFGNDIFNLFTEYGIIICMNICFIILLINTLSMRKNKDEEFQKYKNLNMISLLFFALGVFTFFIKILLQRK
jgi:predicted small integral membrane protein